ncbi:MAG: hypothetical protein IIX75_04645 [Clostridia bacterium]|nr:hypothetical protein [Clostridia bacterium]
MKNKNSFFSNLFSQNGKDKKSDNSYSADGRINLSKISESEESEKKQNILKILFKDKKHKEKYSSDEERPVIDAEAKRISERFNTAHNSLWIVLLTFVVIFCIFFSEGVSTGNMQHIFRNMFGRGEVIESISGYYFSINNNAVFDSISGVPVVAGSDRIVIFSPDGSHEYSEESEYLLPELKASDKIALIYDKGGKAYGIYDEFGQRHFQKDAGGKIYGGAVANDGTYVISRKGNEYMTEINVYTSTFEVINSIKKNNAFASVDIKGNGSEIMLVTYSVSPSGNVESEIMLLKKGEKSPRKLITLENGTPIECKYLKNDNIAILFDKSYCILDKDGNMLSSCAVDINSIYMYSISDDGKLFTSQRIYGIPDTYKTELIHLDGVSMTKLQYTLKNAPVKLNMYGGYAYIITEHEAIRLGAENFNDKKIYRSDKKIEDLIFISKEAFICTADCILKIDWN